MKAMPFFITDREVLFTKGELNFFHDGKTTQSGAYEIRESARIRFKIPRTLGSTNLSVNIFAENKKEQLLSIKSKYKGFDRNNDIYVAALPLRKIGVGLYFFNVEIVSVVGRVYAQRDNGKITFSRDRDPNFQLSVSEFEYEEPTQFQGGIIYHIFVDRFNRGKGASVKSDAIYVSSWAAPIPEVPEFPGAPIKNNYFYGGTLWGVADRLDYIKSLGVNIIYLSPIFESPSNHKYDTADYLKVDEGFGGEDALIYLIKKAKKRGIRLILDGVFNHTGADSIYFNRYGIYKGIGAYQSKDSKYYSWYEFADYPNKYTCWWGIEILPRINPDKEECRSFFTGDGGVIEKYSKMGIGGFRLDVADELSDEFIAEIKEMLSLYNKQSLLYGEVWEDASNKIAYGKRKKYFLGSELDGVMNYPIRKGIISYLRERNTDSLRYALTDIVNNAPKRIRDIQMNLLGTHDTIRIITALAGENPEGKSNEYLSNKKLSDTEYSFGKQRLFLAYTILATIPGIPSVFYGDEVGAEGYSDPFNRGTFPYGKEDKEILDFFKKIGKIRRRNDIYKCGEFKLIHLCEDLLIFSRYDNRFSFITIVNNSGRMVDISFSSPALSLFNGVRSARYTLSAYSSEIFKTRRDIYIEF